VTHRVRMQPNHRRLAGAAAAAPRPGWRGGGIDAPPPPVSQGV